MLDKTSQIFVIQMYYKNGQQTIRAKLPLFFQKSQNTVWCLKVKYSKSFKRAIPDISTCGRDFWKLLSVNLKIS